MYQCIIALLSFFVLIHNSVLAQKLTCPSAKMIKNVRFVSASSHHLDHTLWYLLSEDIVHADQIWRVTFGFFSYTSKNSEQALQEGEKHYSVISLKRQNPVPIWIPGGWFCDYMTEGSDFLISANSPPLATSNT